jgi:hypothetical protein
MAQQTAVEWLEEKYRSLLIEADFNNTYIFIFDERRNELFKQAKQMEKEQIMEAYRQGVQDCPKHNLGEIIRKEQYYNETYNNDTTNGS